ncbi:sigma-70 family RNA polymerase sigma factor [Phenylobacterium sp.]|uniref:RNA polymerase sigma factor n=1 Tax=Phenylobacterium sp. TaxID=1871053 RepID=UPI00262EDADC|nr:sigma-70 family RNA polymerase sigma factor [Phenylobacterium sp.]
MAYDTHESRAQWEAVREVVRRFARRRLGRADLADDIAQETLLRMVDYGRANTIDNVYALALAIAGNLVSEHLRRERRRGEDELTEDLASAQPWPDQVVEGRQAVRALAAALERMPPLRREIIIRRRVRQQSCAAIAREMGLSPKAVEKHVTRGMIDLNKAFKARRRDGSRLS